MALKSEDIGKIRNAEISDIERVVEIANSSLTEYYTTNLMMDLYHSWRDAFMVYTLNDRIIGFIAGGKFSRTEARILLLAVEEKFRHLGIGKALMNDFIDLCRMHNIMSIRLEVRTDNTEAIHFYQKYGFSTISTIRAYYSDSSDAYLMWKLI
ncbi:acetyltransferase [uncultured archaeon]|nr:acetyltransferase [uncultured archaeon]